MTLSADLPTLPRRSPRQKRGERRVCGLLDAAAQVLAEQGYEAATTSAIAERAGASIGSLYQFFPNKAAIARALRDRHAAEYELLWAPLEAEAEKLNPVRLAHRLVEVLAEFVQSHPSSVALLDAPASARTPGTRQRLRARIADLLRQCRPGLSRPQATRIAAVVQEIHRGVMGLYASSNDGDRGWIVEEFKAVLAAYLSARLRP